MQEFHPLASEKTQRTFALPLEASLASGGSGGQPRTHPEGDVIPLKSQPWWSQPTGCRCLPKSSL